MSSFTVGLMLTAFIRSLPGYLSPGHVLISALHYYGHVFEPSQMSIVNCCIALFRLDAGPVAAPLYVAHPFHPEANVAYNVTRFEEIRECFRRSYARLVEAFQTGQSTLLDKVLVNA